MVKLIKYIIQEVSKSDNFYAEGKLFKDAILEAYKKCEEKGLEDEKFSIIKHGYIFTTDSGHYGRFVYEVDRGFSTVNILKYGYINIKSDLFPKVPGPVRKDKRKLESDVVYIKDAWIPKTIMSEVKYTSDKSVYASVSTFHKESIFLMLVNGGLVRRCAYNPFTQCLIVSRYVINNDTFYNVINDVGENPIEDFVFFDLDVKSDFNSGFIHFKLFDVKNMKDKDESYKIIKTLEMLKNNGIKDETMLIFAMRKRKTNKFSYKYFMKTKVIW